MMALMLKMFHGGYLMSDINDPKVKVYTHPECEWSAIAVEEFKKNDIPFDEIDITKVPGAKEEMIEIAGGERITPVIVEGDLVTVGYNGMG